MPQAALAYGFGALASAAGYAALATAFKVMAVNAILGGVSQALAGKPKAVRVPVKATVTGATEPLKLIFGKRRVGGNAVYLGTSGSNNEKLHFVIAHSLAHAGGISDITDVYFDGNKITDAQIDSDGDVNGGTYAPSTGAPWWPDTTWANIRRYLGTSTQTADSTLDTAFTDWASTAYGRGVAYSAIWFYRDKYRDGKFRDLYPNGQPAVSAVVFGNLCYDPRLDSTNGGSGSHRYTDPTTWAYSANPALIAGTYAIMDVDDGGCGLAAATQIDWTVLAASANVCDETRTIPNGSGGSTTQARYECHIQLDTSRVRRDNLKDIAATMAGRIYVAGGKLKVYAGYYTAPAVTVDETYLRDRASMSPKVQLGRTWNAVRASYDRADMDWRTVVAKPYTNSTYETADQNKRLWDDLPLPGTTDEYQAQYLMTIRGRQSRQQRQFTLPCNWRGFDLEAMQTITVDLDEFGASFVGRIVDWQHTMQGPTITVVADASSVWTSTYATDYTETNGVSTPAVTKETPITPAGYSPTATTQGVVHKWDPVPDDAVTDIYSSLTSGGTFALVTTVAGNTAITPSTGGVTVYFKIKHRYRNTESAYSSEVSTAASGAATIPDYRAAGAGAAVTSDSVDFVGEFDTDAAGIPVPYPSGISAGEILVLHIGCQGGGSIDTIEIDEPSGWTAVGEVASASGAERAGLWWKRATGSETGIEYVAGRFKVGSTPTHHSGNVAAGRMYAFSSVLASGTPYEGSASSARSASTSITAENITTSTNNTLACQFVFLAEDETTASFTGESGVDYTEQATYGTTTGGDVALQLQAGDKASAGAITGGSMTIGTSQISIVHGFALKPVV